MRNAEAKHWFDKGTEAFDSGNFEEAINCYAEAAQLGPDNAPVFFNWGLSLYQLARIKNDESLFRQSIEKHEKAAQLDPDDAGIFINWGSSLSGLAIIKNDETLFRQSIEKHEKAAQLDPDDAAAFYNWGNSLYQLARIKNDESLFRQSIEKYEKAAQLDPDDAAAFYNWGNSLSELALIKNDESLFWQSIEKYDEATQIDPHSDKAFFNWGNSLFKLAGIKNDETLFRQSIEKYEKAAQLDPDNARAFYNWGNSLYQLARIKNDESLFREAIEKYEKATQINPHYDKAFFNRGGSLYELANITKDESLFSESVQCFIKSKTDILHILVFFDNDDWNDTLKKNILYPLLALDTSDGQFFMEITRNIDKNEWDKYKEAYLLSVYIISKLHVNNPREEFVAHYREKTISYKMLFDNTKFRLNAINYSNDPKEGETLLDYLYKARTPPAKEPLNTEYIAFAGCFSFNYDSLNQFRLYGKEDGREGTGLSLVFKKSFFSKDAKISSMSEQSPAADKNVKPEEKKPEEKKHALFRCIYVDPETRRVETVGQKDGYLFYRERNENKITDHKNYKNYINDIIKIINENMEKLKIQVADLDQEVIGQLLINLRYLTKHIAFKEEQECRIVKIHNIKDKGINPSGNFKQMYVEYDPKVSINIKEIYFGPNAGGMKLFQDILTHKGLAIPYKQSKNPLA